MICPCCHGENQPGAGLCAQCGEPLALLGPGSVLASRYQIVDRLGKGGMGTVYRARDTMLDEVVALKVLRADLGGTPEMGERFRSEIRLARKVTHRNVCRIHEYGEDGPHRFISMQLLDGEDLRQMVRRRGGLPPEEAFEVAIQVAEGLQAIHDEGIIHRDLKSPNIMRDGRGVARLMDFGIAKQWQEGDGGGLTMAGQIVGTPEYMSPEQVRGEKLDFRSDVYALGIVVFELFTGQLPFKGDTAIATIMKQLQEPPPLEGERARGIPEPVVPVLRKAMAKDAADRYGSASDLGEALRLARAAAFAQLSPAAPAAPPSPASVTGAVTAVPAAVPVTSASPAAPATVVPIESLTPIPAGTVRLAAPPTAVSVALPVALPPASVPPAEAPQPPGPVQRRGRLGWGLSLAAAGLAAGGLVWVNRRPPVKVVDAPPASTPAPSTPDSTMALPSASPLASGPPVSPATSVTPRPHTAPGDGVDLRTLDQLARDNPEAALGRLMDLERRRPGDPGLAERRLRWQAQLTGLALERARRTVAQAEAEESLDLYARGVQELTRVVQGDPTSGEAREALAEAIGGEARLKARRSLTSFVLSGTTVTGVTPNVINAPPGMGEAPPGVIIKKAEVAPLKAKIVIEAEPSQVKKGETMTVRYYLENQTASPLHVSDALVQTVVGQGATTGGKIEPQTKLAQPRGKALLLESRDAWRLDPGTDWKTTLRVVLADGTVLTGSLQARR